MLDQATLGNGHIEPTCCRTDVTSSREPLSITVEVETLTIGSNELPLRNGTPQNHKCLNGCGNGIEKQLHPTSLGEAINGVVAETDSEVIDATDSTVEATVVQDAEDPIKEIECNGRKSSESDPPLSCPELSEVKHLTQTNGDEIVETVNGSNLEMHPLVPELREGDNVDGSSAESEIGVADLVSTANGNIIKEISSLVKCNGSVNGIDAPISNGSSHSETSEHMNGHIPNGGLVTANGVAKTNGVAPSKGAAIPASDFRQLLGELISYTGQTSNGGIVLTNYRIFLYYNKNNTTSINLPLGVIDSVESRDLLYLQIHTKHAYSVNCSFSSVEQCLLWSKRLNDGLSTLTRSDTLFCHSFYRATLEMKDDQSTLQKVLKDSTKYDATKFFLREIERMKFLENGAWRISNVNDDFSFCPSYPKYLIVPSKTSDEDLRQVAAFRSSQRIPTAVWRYEKNGCIIARSSQPYVGWLCWRNEFDENLLNSLCTSCTSQAISFSSNKLLVLDARSYAAAVANRAKGGGVECPEYYLSSEVQFMGLANIHSIRKSFQSIRSLYELPTDHPNWLAILENSKWLNHISALIKSALIAVNAIDQEARPVLVHCSDGWDRTPQVVALAQLMLDPYYRTIEGFQTLVTREWIEFGHKFAERNGVAPVTDDPNERCPVFLQWLDCVHQIVKQFPSSFEFNQQYLAKLIYHTTSCLFGTFTCNNMSERHGNQIYERSHSVWTFFAASRDIFKNKEFLANDEVLRPSCLVKDMIFWSEVYTPTALLVAAHATTSISVSNLAHHPAGLAASSESCLNGAHSASQEAKSCENKMPSNGLNGSSNENGQQSSESELSDQEGSGLEASGDETSEMKRKMREHPSQDYLKEQCTYI